MSEKIAKIICIDDEDIILKSLSRILEPQYHVLTAHNAEKGLELLTENPDTAIIIADFQLPGMNGLDFLQKSKEKCPSTIRIILSGNIHLKEMEQAINQSIIHRFILKPWDNKYLLLQIKGALQHHLLLQENFLLQKLSVTDPITNLTNHRYFQESFLTQLKEARDKQESLSLILMDVDHFKNFNDNYGHPAGDTLLRAIAERLIMLLEHKVSVISRYGGEEFIVTLPNTNIHQAHLIAETLRKGLEQKPFEGPQGRPAYITMSVGLSTFPDHGQTADELLIAADKALYQAKKQGRNQTVIAGGIKNRLSY